MNILSNMQSRVMGWFSDPVGFLLSMVAIFLALSIHECAHAFAADWAGDPTAKNLGRKTLNPLKHIDPMGFVFLIFVGFGWAKPVPVNPNNFRKPQRDTLIVSLAGVATNLVLSFISIFLMVLIWRLTQNATSGFAWINGAISFFDTLAVINLSFMAFNLLPIPPLDGWNALKSLLLGRMNLNWIWNYERYGQFILLFLLLLGGVSWLLSPIVNGVYNGFLSFWFWALF